MAKAIVVSGMSPQVVNYFAGWQGFAIEIALQDIATEFGQKITLRLGFNPFGNEFQTQIVAEGNRR